MRLSEVATNKKQQITNFIEHAWFFLNVRQIRKRGNADNLNCGQEKHLLAATYSENNLTGSYRLYLS